VEYVLKKSAEEMGQPMLEGGSIPLYGFGML